MIVYARFGTPCPDCDAATDQQHGEACPSHAAARSSVPAPRAQATVSPPAWLGERDGLSAHEGAIVSLIVLGLSNQEIADALHVDLPSVKTHIRSAYRTMGVTRRTHAILWGADHGFQLTASGSRIKDGGRR